MSANLARLRKRAAELEQKKQFDRALEVYVQILDEGGKDLDDEDVPLFNRVGDMLMRKGSVTEALGYYERAVDMYAERGYLNNAIALCGKILRVNPGRTQTYLKLASMSDLDKAVVARVPAGCNPVRVALSPAGDRVYVTARGSNAVQVFDAGKLLGDREHSLQASVPVGQSPVGLAVDGAHVFVANSDRFGGGQHQSLSVLDPAHLDASAGSIPAGGFPRELRITSDGKSLLVTNFESGSVELIDLARLDEAMRGAGK